MGNKSTKTFIVLLVVSIIGLTIFSGSVAASTSGDEHRMSISQRLGEDNGNASDDSDYHRSEQRCRAEDS